LSSECAEYQPKSVDLVLRLLFIPVPIVLLIISSVCVYFYPITEKKVKENALKLESIRKR
jgi:Na+/melibiose symporter-like transporter